MRSIDRLDTNIWLDLPIFSTRGNDYDILQLMT